MKKVIVMRHSKSSWDSSKISDSDRPLNDRGLFDAPVMGSHLLKKKIIPDLIICSPALRTRMTIELILEKLNKNIDICYSPVIYENNAGDIIKLITKIDDNISNLMIVGHNPSMHEIAQYFTNDKFPFNKFSTSGVAVINFSITGWHSVVNNYGVLEYYATPKMLK